MSIIKKVYLTPLLVFASLFLVFLFTGGCANTNRAVVKKDYQSVVFSLEDAHNRYGEPDAVVRQADGLIRHSWIYRESEKKRDRKVIWHDGLFREERIIKGSTITNYCFLSVFTNDAGEIVNTTWEGNACSQLGVLKRSGRKTNTLPDAKRALVI